MISDKLSLLNSLLYRLNETENGLIKTIEHQTFYADISGMYDGLTANAQHQLLELEAAFNEGVERINPLLQQAFDVDWNVNSGFMDRLIDLAIDLDNSRKDIGNIHLSPFEAYERADYD